ncbi:MAG: acyl-CoA dehydratase activase-related protein [bacterium]
MNLVTPYQAGLDIGSTTAKIAVVDERGDIIFSAYCRHHTRIYETIDTLLENALDQLGDCTVTLQITGSAGMGIAEKTGIPFIQEIIATDVVIKNRYPEVRTLIDIGGEDSKMIFFSDKKLPDMRMNGNCAGGTGAFIDQIASLLNVEPQELNTLAANHRNIYSIASRCGVFAKTDVQNLLSRKIPKEDIAASIFHAVAIQCMNTLARGFEIKPKIMLCGGPFTFLSELGRIFLKAIKMEKTDLLIPERPELLPALGAAIDIPQQVFSSDLRELRASLHASKKRPSHAENRLEPLFRDQAEFIHWKETHANINIKKMPLGEYDRSTCFIGIDSGSTTTKIIVTGLDNELLFSWYQNNRGNAVDTVIHGLEAFRAEIRQHNPPLKIGKTTVTGYGEDLIRAAFGIDKGVVETIAHFTAARHISPQVSFVLDIGGQDMKAIFIENGIINRIELNEACSSGCGSFIETFGNSLNYPVSDFAEIACQAEAPCDLGTRCTVFMNSKVKQSLRENASAEVICCGLSYSVVINCLFKVLKLNDMSELGDQIVLQGGTFKNLSIVRALEKLTGKTVTYSDIPELMGAFGASLIARQAYEQESQPSTFIDLDNLGAVNRYTTKQLHCKGCENNCVITRFNFGSQRSFFSGNKCEKFFNSQGQKTEPGTNLFETKQKLLFDRAQETVANPRLTIGIPRVLNLFENFPFWHTLFTVCGIQVVLSPPSTMEISERGLGTVMSDSICFPAKLVHGHIMALVEQKVDRIFYPMVIYEKKEFDDTANSYNCPIVSGYPEVIGSAVNPAQRFHIPLDKPIITFDNTFLLIKTCTTYLKQFGISKTTVRSALEKALAAQQDYKTRLKEKAAEMIQAARESHKLLIVLAGRPYHADSLINHKTPEILASLGADVITEDALPLTGDDEFDPVQMITQWSYPNRIFKAAQWVITQPDNIQFVQFNSFGCGPDALVTDETKEILKSGRKNYTLIKIDEITSTGSVRLRLRSMVESLKMKKAPAKPSPCRRQTTPVFGEKDKTRTILVPYFADKYSLLIPAVFKAAGYHVVNLPRPDRASVETGLRYASNDICYPATIIIGDIIKALQTGNFNHEEIAIGITQTGGQCRASNYLPLIKKALLAAGFKDIPVISITTSQGLNDQPGFEMNWLKILKVLFLAMMMADSLAKMYYAIAPREKNRGESADLHTRFLKEAETLILHKDYPGM